MSRSLAAFLALLPLVVVPGVDDPARLPQSVFLLVGILVAWLIQHRRAAPNQAGGSWLRWPILLLLGWAALSTLWARNRYEAALSLLQWSAAALVFLLVLRVVASVTDARRLLLALFVSCFVVSTIGLLQHLAGWDALPQAYPPAGTLANKNVAAAWVAMALPVGAVSFLIASPLIAWAFSGAIAVAAAYLFHAGSRAAWLAVCVQILTAVLLMLHRCRGPRLPPKRWGALAFGGALFFLLIGVPPAGTSQTLGSPGQLLTGTAHPLLRLLVGDPVAPEADVALNPLSGEERAARSVEIRLAVWRNSLEMLLESPFHGVGLGNFAVEYPRFSRAVVGDGTRIDQRVEAAHNDYLQLATELGLVGVVLLGWLGAAAGRVFRAAATPVEAEAGRLRLACGLGFLGVVVSAAIAPTVSQPSALAALATFLGIGVALRERGAAPVSARERPREPGPGRASALWLSATAAAFALSVLWGYAQLRADRHVLAMARAENAQDWPGVLREGMEARRWNPFRRDPLFAMASASLHLGHADDAAALLRELLAVYPNNVNAVGNLGIAYLTLGQPDAAAPCFERVLRLRPEDALAGSMLARARHRAELGGSP